MYTENSCHAKQDMSLNVMSLVLVLVFPLSCQMCMLCVYQLLKQYKEKLLQKKVKAYKKVKALIFF
jgi:hypothetical protein